MTSPQEFLEREAAAWAAFEAQVDRVPAEDRERPGVVEGWSVKDVVWHCAYWAAFSADAIEAAGDGPFRDPFDAEPDEHWDAVNAEVAVESSGMTWNDVQTGADAARARIRDLVASGAVPDDATTWSADETFIHYDEHAEHVRAFADALG
jgi:hypothetical protein